MNLIDCKLMIGQEEICDRPLEGRLSACHIVRPSINVGCTVTRREGRDLEIIDTVEKGEAVRAVFRRNIAKHGSGTKGKRDTDKQCRMLLGGQWKWDSRKDDLA